MLKKKWINWIVIMVLLLTSTFSVITAHAEEEYEDEYQEEYQEDDTTISMDSSSNLGGYKGLVAHWKFDSDLKDSSQFNNHGEAIGGKSGSTLSNEDG